MRILFTTLQDPECEFYGRVGRELERLGHTVSHVTYSAKAAADLQRGGLDATALRDLMPSLEEVDVPAHVRRIEATYAIPSIRDVYRTDPPCTGRPEEWCLARTALHFLALERKFAEFEPDILIPEVGNELIRAVAHLVALAQGVPTFLLFYTLFPKPLRLCVDDMRARIVDPGEIRPLSETERSELEEFRHTFTARAEPIRAYRRRNLTGARMSRLAQRTAAKLGADRSNEYLRPGRWTLDNLVGVGRHVASRALYQEADETRKFVYFPLHDTHDYKIRRLVPHCFDQASIIEQVAEALPPGYDLVVKEHPMSLGRNRIGLMRRLRRQPNIRLVGPFTNTHELIRRSSGVAVISSTVGIEALLYGKPVLTLGRPFYSGYGVTLDVDSFADISTAVPQLLRFRPDLERVDWFLHAAMRACRPGKPVTVDSSDENAVTLAHSLAAAAAEHVGVEPEPSGLAVGARSA